MKWILGAIATTAFLIACAAQSVSFESVRLADALTESSWPTLERSMPLLISGMRSQFVANGADETASRVLSEEIRRNLTRENLSKALASRLTERFSEPEMKELFVHALSAGAKVPADHE